MSQGLRHWSRLAVHLGNNPLSLLGAALTLPWFWFLEVTSRRSVHPYVGLLLFLFLPAAFLLGLLLIPIGLRGRRLRLGREGRLPTEYPKVDLGAPVVRNTLLVWGPRRWSTWPSWEPRPTRASSTWTRARSAA